MFRAEISLFGHNCATSVLQRLTNEADLRRSVASQLPTSAFFVGTNPTGELITSGLPSAQNPKPASPGRECYRLLTTVIRAIANVLSGPPDLKGAVVAPR